jgi:hypothetical protein
VCILVRSRGDPDQGYLKIRLAYRNKPGVILTISTEFAESWILDDTRYARLILKQLILKKHVVVTRRMAAFRLAKRQLFALVLRRNC